MTLPDDMYMGEQQHRAHMAVRGILSCAEELGAILSEDVGGLRSLKVEEQNILEAAVKLHNLLFWVSSYGMAI